MNGVAVVAAIALVAVVLLLKSPKTRFTLRLLSGERKLVGGNIDDPAVQAELRALGIDPAALERDVVSGHEDGKFHIEKHFSISTATPGPPPAGFLEHAHPLEPDEALRFIREPAFQEQLRKQGVDPAKFEHDIATGAQKVYGTEARTSIVIGGHRGAPPAPPVAPPPAPESFAPPSDDGDKVWKTGEL